MSAPETSLVVIACPYCSTRYQVDYAAIGAGGRTVACAHCGKSWEAHAEAPRPARPQRTKDFRELAEEELDQKIVDEERRHREKREAAARAEEEARAAKVKARADAVAASEARAVAKAGDDAAARAGAIAPRPTGTGAAADTAGDDGAERSPEHQKTLDNIKAAIGPRPGASLDAATHKLRQHAFSQRQLSLYSRLPIARFRRAARLGVLGVFVLLVGGGLLLRGSIVQQFPQLAGAYAAIGLGVNVIGLEFRDVKTLKSLQQGQEVLAVDGTILSVAGQEVAMPQVIVTLLGAKGEALYEWSVAPKAAELEPGETLPFETQLTSPPEGAMGVKLTFANGRRQSKASDRLPHGDMTIVVPGTVPAAGAVPTVGTTMPESPEDIDDGQDPACGG